VIEEPLAGILPSPPAPEVPAPGDADGDAPRSDEVSDGVFDEVSEEDFE
jgi:hypothetical protein